VKKKLLITLLLLILSNPVFAFQCNQCHSKNPKMVKMHKALGFKDCFKCHGINAKIDKNNLKAQMFADDRCTGCHKK